MRKCKLDSNGYSWVIEDNLHKLSTSGIYKYEKVGIKEVKKQYKTIQLYRACIGQGCSFRLPIEYEPLSIADVEEWLKEKEVPE